MNEEILRKAQSSKLIFVSGKTCTGKTTFAKQLAADLDCSVIETDEIVRTTKSETVADKFREIYKSNSMPELIDEFVGMLRQEIINRIATNGRVVFEGAIANNDVLERVIEGFEDSFLFIYLHPINKVKYVSQITKRFLTSSVSDKAGLPSSFYRLIELSDLQSFYQTREMSSNIQTAIETFAEQSMVESSKRLGNFHKYFEVEVISI